MSILVLAFVVCWLPFWILYTALQFCIHLKVRELQKGNYSA